MRGALGRGGRAVLALCAIGLTVTATGAGASERATAGTPGGIVNKAVKTSEGEGSADITVDISLDAPGLGSQSLVELAGAATFGAPLRGTFVVTTVSASGNGETSFREVFAHNTYYVHVDGTWYEQSAQASLSQAGLSGSLTGGDPSQILQVLEAHGAVVTKMGSRNLDGVTTTEYRAVVNMAEALSHPAGSISATPAALQEFSQLTSSPTFPINLWLDSASRIREMKMSLPLSPTALAKFGLQGAPKGLSIILVLAFSHYGVKVVAAPPPASEVQPVPTTTPTTLTS